ncbi:MAG: VOC family protein [Dehalococcoidia bacterium]
MTTAARQGVPTQLGHVALRVRDVDRAVQFYRDVLGLEVKSYTPRAAFLGIRPDASHELALFPLGDKADGPDPRRVGMYHSAWEMASFADLEQLHQRLLAHNTQIAGYNDRGWNVMFLDPDGNELEAIWEPSAEERAEQPGGAPLPRLSH